MLSRALKFFYSNIKLTTKAEQQAIFLTLSNSKKRNPLSLTTIREINSALIEVEQQIPQQKLKILILQGEGPAFSAGHDLKQLKASENPQAIFQECTQTLLKLKKLPIVTICAVNGIAAAAGFQMALTCDLLIATQKSSFSTPGVKWGLFCSTPGVQLIRSINSQKKAKEMLLYGESISAQEAYQYGLINRVVAEEKLEEEIGGYISRVQALSGEVLALGKKIFDEQSKTELQQAYCIATKGMHENIVNKDDCREGLSAFAEKRSPSFKN